MAVNVTEQTVKTVVCPLFPLLGQDSVWLRKNLAKAYLSLGDKGNAVRNWKNVLKFNPFDHETRALVEKYSRGM